MIGELANMIRLEDVFTFKNLLKSYYHCLSGKRYRNATVKYHINHYDNLKRLLDEILSGKYKIRGMYTFIVYEPKKRYITATHFEDKIVQRIIAKYVLAPAIQSKLIYDNYASQPLKGTMLAVNRAEKFMRSYIKQNDYDPSGSIMTGDIEKFFYMIDKTICCDQVDALNIDSKLKRLIRDMIYAYTEVYNEYSDNPNLGLCIGFEPSQWLSGYYLNPLDHFVKETLQIKYYGRYADDFYIIHDDQSELTECFGEIKNFISSELNLTMNKKSHIHPYKQGLCFLGYHMTYNPVTHYIDTEIRAKSVHRMRKRLFKQLSLLEADEMTYEQAKTSIDSWYSYVSKGLTAKSDNAYSEALTLIDPYQFRTYQDPNTKLLISENSDVFSERNYKSLVNMNSKHTQRVECMLNKIDQELYSIDPAEIDL